ncbi:uncharacterized protein MELLADRAFT_105329 [Melampsora larici-populina 98AG31]|uniref:Uncharacterized protein n=1 Tax=Melampsora larici-populina (strain 98AG31 / pathotype 3-4-7) TaxID=747676 RepID=F4RHS1_MELLP|nr:uncharacterized protein MELLADRAFT_105329 [Melampsora larici-populina 98AG31]EGG07874.1 hypothetical protein MELLADRAFT_105329 [Melampsora larici-populina 98AG31]
MHVSDEIERQRAKMDPCDCSNCRPEEAEALWQAQSALTTNNFECALAMGETELTDLAANLGPKDFFDIDSAWDLAKNVDVLTTPSDLALVLVSEMIPNQFEMLFTALTQWREELDSAAAMANAKAHRLSTIWPNVQTLPPLSVEGACIQKARADALKVHQKELRELERQQAQEDKEAERTQRAQDKLDAAALAKRLALESKANKAKAKLEAAAETKRRALEIKAQKRHERHLATEQAKQAAAEAKAAERAARLLAAEQAKHAAAEVKAAAKAKRARDKAEATALTNATRKRAKPSMVIGQEPGLQAMPSASSLAT